MRLNSVSSINNSPAFGVKLNVSPSIKEAMADSSKLKSVLSQFRRELAETPLDDHVINLTAKDGVMVKTGQGAGQENLKFPRFIILKFISAKINFLNSLLLVILFTL